MAMTSYNGPATLVDDSHEIAVEAHLVRDDEPGHLDSWGGFVKCDPDALFPVVGTIVTIHLPGRGDGAVLIMGGGKVEGSGRPPPFDHEPTA